MYPLASDTSIFNFVNKKYHTENTIIPIVNPDNNTSINKSLSNIDSLGFLGFSFIIFFSLFSNDNEKS